MVDETLYITPHEAALAVVATAMKKARLRLDTLVLNSIAGGALFSAGGMLALCIESENPGLWENNPGMIHIMQGLVFPIGLFFVVIMGAELFNSNILYFSVAVCRGAVSIFDLFISWFVSWLFNLATNIFISYMCHLSGVAQSPQYKAGAIRITDSKLEPTFIQNFIRGCFGNFCVCLAVYLQLLAKPLHVKLLLMGLPVFTFVTMQFNHAVADMFLVPMGYFEGSKAHVTTYIWRSLIPVSLGNIVGGFLFCFIIPFYLHLIVVERDRELLNLPQYEAKDEQPELEMDSRVVRVPTQIPVNYPNSNSSSDTDNGKPFEKQDDIEPVSYRPENESSGLRLHPTSSSVSRRSPSVRSPPGVFPVMGMGEPLTREKTIASGIIRDDIGDDQEEASLYSKDESSALSRTMSIATAARKTFKDKQRQEEDQFERNGGYNARENALGESLKKMFTRSDKNERSQDPELGIGTVPSNSSGLFQTLSKTFSQKNPESATELNERLRRQSITRTAANASDNIAGIDKYDLEEALQRPPTARRHVLQAQDRTAVPLSAIGSDQESRTSSLSSYSGSDGVEKKSVIDPDRSTAPQEKDNNNDRN